MAQATAVVVRPEPVARVALRILRVVRTIRNFLVSRQWRSDLTGLYDLCIVNLSDVVYYPHPARRHGGSDILEEVRRSEGRLRRAERRQALPAPGSADGVCVQRAPVLKAAGVSAAAPGIELAAGAVAPG